MAEERLLPHPDQAALREPLAFLATEQVNDRYRNLDEMTTAGLVAAMNAEDAFVAGAVAAESTRITAAIDGIVAKLQAGGRLLYIGADTAGRMGILDASECPPTFGTDQASWSV